MGLNVEKLVQGLEDYNASIDHHLAQLLSDFNSLQEFFHHLASQYDGQAAEQFKMSWGHTAEWFEQYLSESKALSKFLEQRVTALKEQNQT
jgi:hypothetical protein